MAPTWNKLADKLNKSKNVRIAKYDCTKHKEISELIAVRGYPSLVMIPKESKDTTKKTSYSGDRTIEAFEEWLAK